MWLLALLLICLFTARCAAADATHNLYRPDRFVSNHTLSPLTNNLDVTDESQSGSADFVRAGVDGRTAWPFRRQEDTKHINDGYLRIIPICFVDDRSFTELSCRINEAIGLWFDALGGAPSANTGHNLHFEIKQDPKQGDFCCSRYDYGKEGAPWAETDLTCYWNDGRYPEDALVVHWIDDGKSNRAPELADIGYTPKEVNAHAHRHTMIITESASAVDVAHGLGHVFGLIHEHQRWDRDDHVYFNCYNVYGMPAAIQRLLDEPGNTYTQQTATDALCTNYLLAVKYNAPSVAYIKGQGVSPTDASVTYDLDSIMHYESFTPGAPALDIRYATLYNVHVINGQLYPAQDWYIRPRRLVSAGDAAWVRANYPWDEAKFQQHRNGKEGPASASKTRHTQSNESRDQLDAAHAQHQSSRNGPIPANISSNLPSDPQPGYAEFISSSFEKIEAWPFRKSWKSIGQGYRRIIPVCFVDQFSYDMTKEKLTDGFKVWFDKIGIASEQNQHCLDYEWKCAPKPEDFCCTKYTYGKLNQPFVDGEMNCEWNNKYTNDVLAIHYVDLVKGNNQPAQATVGYVAAEHDSRPDRHHIYINEEAKAHEVAHEIGHALGMVHEQQRWDRDEYLEFRCNKLSNMRAPLERLMQDRKDLSAQAASDLLCSDAQIAEQYRAPSFDWIKGAGLDSTSKPKLDSDGGLDFKSIMLYSSFTGTDMSAYAQEAASMIKIRIDPATGQKVPATDWMIDTNLKPSDGDANFVKKFYAWDQARYLKDLEDEAKKPPKPTTLASHRRSRRDEPAPEDPQTGYAEYISSKSLNREVWPYRKSDVWKIDEGYHRTIPLCYVDRRSYEKIFCALQGGIKLWADALGGVSNAETHRHSVAFTEIEYPTDDQFCCKKYSYGVVNETRKEGDLHCDEWNPIYPDDTLAIHWIDDVKGGDYAALATSGYVRKEHDPTPGRHNIEIKGGANANVVAHEIGHVFGLAHEFQRWDRDDYVKFNCQNLAGLRPAVERMKEDARQHNDPMMSDSEIMEIVCTDMVVAVHFGSPSVNFIKGDGLNGWDQNARPQFDGETGFDTESIMMYNSFSSSMFPEERDRPDRAVLYKIKKDENGNILRDGRGDPLPADNWKLVLPEVVSPKDVGFIEKFYPWDQKRYQQHLDEKAAIALSEAAVGINPSSNYFAIAQVASNVHSNTISDPQGGSAEKITSGPNEIWPLRRGWSQIDRGYKRAIPVCFADRNAWEKLRNCGPWLEGKAMWVNGLGNPNRVRTHNLIFKEINSPRDDQFCYKRDTYNYGIPNQPKVDGEMTGEWNDMYTADTLVIHWVDDVKGGNVLAFTSGIGYENAKVNPRKGRHSMEISSRADAGDVAHEIGHVLGLSHEFQRWDRDDYIHWTCENVDGVDEAVEDMRTMENISGDEALTKLCSDMATAVRYGSPITDWIKGDGLDTKTQPPFDGLDGFDFDSIMMYGSFGGSESGMDQSNPYNSVMYKIMGKDENGNIMRDPHGYPLPAQDWRMQKTSKVSRRDLLAIQRLYPWDQQRYEQYNPGGSTSTTTSSNGLTAASAQASRVGH